jgi:hypothetical protein
MRTEYLKGAVTAAWVLSIAALAAAVGSTSAAGWTALVMLSVVPPALMLRYWSPPARSMSETIRDVLR